MKHSAEILAILMMNVLAFSGCGNTLSAENQTAAAEPTAAITEEYIWHSMSSTGHDHSSVAPHLYNCFRMIFQ